MFLIFNFAIEFLISRKSQFGTEGDKIYTWVKVKISKLKPGKSNSAHDNQIDRLRIAQRWLQLNSNKKIPKFLKSLRDPHLSNKSKSLFSAS